MCINDFFEKFCNFILFIVLTVIIYSKLRIMVLNYFFCIIPGNWRIRFDGSRHENQAKGGNLQFKWRIWCVVWREIKEVLKLFEESRGETLFWYQLYLDARDASSMRLQWSTALHYTPVESRLERKLNAGVLLQFRPSRNTGDKDCEERIRPSYPQSPLPRIIAPPPVTDTLRQE